MSVFSIMYHDLQTTTITQITLFKYQAIRKKYSLFSKFEKNLQVF